MATTNTSPSISVIFTQKAKTANMRGSRGRVGLIINDDTNKTFTNKTYKLISEVEADIALYTAENLQFIKDCFLGVPATVSVVRIDIGGVIADALTIIRGLKIDWMGTASSSVTDQTAVATFIKEQESLFKFYKGVVFNNSADVKHVVNFVNSKVTFTDSLRGEKTGNELIPTLLGVFAGLPLSRSATYLKVTNLKSVVEEVNIDTSIGLGKLCLFNDDIDVVKISTAVNSLTTIDKVNTEIMSKIEAVETMDLITNDISSSYKNDYVGTFKNKTDYQFLFIGAVNTYFKGLAKEDILDNLYDNKSLINIEAQRDAYVASGKTEAETWDDGQVIVKAFRNKLFLMADVKFLEAMEALQFGITIF
ncbi:phage tail sheath C-terminal domain-containing protein [Clostridium sp. FP1]|uniref:phage tail sheath C-terminal domain-containing protein n=1 Tax=Clostridium sp. FP1 TaxID=2724076 RepID=UPI0013E95157|nr:phage tail sheath C-terminal domain-containing protein [Clostridium sp. FP1]MBZ9635499.1 phage tail sheath protein [Clostridium sp. FP1]